MNDYINNTCRNIQNPSTPYDIPHTVTTHSAPIQPHNPNLTPPEQSPNYNSLSDTDSKLLKAKYDQLNKVKTSNAKKLKMTLICFIITAFLLFAVCIFQIINIHDNIMTPSKKIISTNQTTTEQPKQHHQYNQACNSIQII